ncbi:hypothetical protein KGO95_04485 [Patescibacteria group bacterium]|nr:hypothetical protein [Patescibacteria group bacterium]
MDSLITLIQLGGIGFLIAAALFYLNEACVVFVPAFSVVLLMSKLAGKKRTIASGWHLKFPWEIAVDDPIVVKSENESFDLRVVFGDDQAGVTLKISFYRTPSINHAIRYFEIDPGTRTASVVDRVRSVAQAHLQKCKSMEEVLERQKEIELSIQIEVSGEPGKDSDLERRIGEVIDHLVISNVEVPDEVFKAEAERVAQRARNERMLSESKTLQEITRKALEDSVVDGKPTIPYEKANVQTLAQFGKGNVKIDVNEEIKTVGLDEKNRDLVKDLGAMILKFLLERGGAGSVKEGGDGQH